MPLYLPSLMLNLQKSLERVAFAGLGAGLGWAAWGVGRTPLLAVVFPVLLFVTRDRVAAFLCAAAYHAAVLRFMGDYVDRWFGSIFFGAALHVALAVVCGASWALFWTASDQRWKVAVASASAFLMAMVPPVGMIIAGHPLFAWGFVLPPGIGWLGVVMAVMFTAAGAVATRGLHALLPRNKAAVGLAVLAVAWVVGGVASQQQRNPMRVAGHWVSFVTHLGEPPRTDEAVLERIEGIEARAGGMRGGVDRADVLVFPETSIGRYDSTYDLPLRNTLLRPARAAGQSLVVGMELVQPDGLHNVARLYRPDGTQQTVSERQPAPFSMWHPWRRDENHYPANWWGDNVLEITPGVRASVVICYEEYLPLLALISEARGAPQVVIAMANSWAAPNDVAVAVQATHTEGMARLFGHPVLRANNLPAPRHPAAEGQGA